MFLQSSTKYIKPELNDFADKIEKDSPGLSVFAARQFCYKLYQTPIQIEITKELYRPHCIKVEKEKEKNASNADKKELYHPHCIKV